VNGNPAFTPLGIDQVPAALQPGGNMEGKEVRFGPVQSALFSVVTTVTSCGAVNSMHDSFMPLGGFVQMFDIQLGEIVFGGVGSGLYCMLIFVILAMFIAGLMVGRTPELYGKKIEPREMALSTIHILIPIFHPRPHGHCGPHGRRVIGGFQPRTARLLRDPVRVHLCFPE
jgi:K+-transporting ATPase ATPase A chain